MTVYEIGGHLATCLISITCSDCETFTQTQAPQGTAAWPEIRSWPHQELLQEAKGTSAALPPWYASSAEGHRG
jgi:hypothetical protein